MNADRNEIGVYRRSAASDSEFRQALFIVHNRERREPAGSRARLSQR
jgi:hypothetical protein